MLALRWPRSAQHWDAVAWGVPCWPLLATSTTSAAAGHLSSCGPLLATSAPPATSAPSGPLRRHHAAAAALRRTAALSATHPPHPPPIPKRLQGFYDGITLLLRNAVEKKTVLENLDLVLLAMDEICEGG